MLSDDLEESNSNLENHITDASLDLTNSSNVANAGESILDDTTNNNGQHETAADTDPQSLLTEQNLAHHDENHQEVARVLKVISAESPPSPATAPKPPQVNESHPPVLDDTFVSATDESLLANGTANGHPDDTTNYDNFGQV